MNLEKISPNMVSLNRLGLTLGLGVFGLGLEVCADSQKEERSHSDGNGLPEIHIDISDTQNPWTGLDLNNDPRNFQFAIITDNTTGGREGILEDAFMKLNWLQPEFVMSVGDLIQGYTEDRKQLAAEWNEFEGFVSSLEMPFFYVPGNHDYTNPVMAEVWEERYGDSFYSFTYHDVFCLVLNSNDEARPHAMTQEQVDWAIAELEKNPDPRWTLVFIHSPLWDMNRPEMWSQIEDKLQGRDFTVFAGHHHRYVKNSRNGSNFYTLATTGGNSQLRGPRFGEFDHVVWVTMTDEGPVMANLLLEGIWGEDVRDTNIRDVQSALIDDGSLSLQPIVYRGDGFEEGSFGLRLTNDSDYPVAFEMQFKQLENISLDGERQGNWDLPPNEVLKLDFEVKNETSDLEQGWLAEMDWKLSFDYQGESIEFEGSEPLGLARELPIDAVDEIEVDGDLSDWTSLEYSSPEEADWHYHRHWDGDDDSRFDFGLSSNDEYLYIGISVEDDSVVADETGSIWAHDGISVLVDARPKAIRNVNTSDRGPLVYSIAPIGEDTLRVAREDRLPEGSVYAGRKTDDGYEIEIAVPVAYLNEKAGGDWEGVRVNVMVNDKDENKDGLARIFWNPSWRRSDATPGAGSFYRK